MIHIARAHPPTPEGVTTHNVSCPKIGLHKKV